ncbi:hypothetical protein QTP70_025544, partial [Hemibagrus guttatus]
MTFCKTLNRTYRVTRHPGRVSRAKPPGGPVSGFRALIAVAQCWHLIMDSIAVLKPAVGPDSFLHSTLSKQIGKAAEALVSKHPCLKENGSKTGYEGWKNSLRFKMGNYRAKLSRAGIKDVAVNAGKYSRTNPQGAASRANIKRPRRGEVNFLPNYPHGQTKDTLETQRLEM